MPASTAPTRPNPFAAPTFPDDLLPAEVIPGSQPRRSRLADEAAVVHVDGEIDTATAPELAELIRSRIESAVNTVVVDLSQVEFLGVAGLSVLSTAAQQAEREHVTLRVVTGPRCVARALRAVGAVDGLEDRLACYPSLDDALNR